jgi:hypothetical protein
MLTDRLRELELQDRQAWLAESLRLTAFPTAAAPFEFANATGWWQELVGQPPEAHVARPRLSGFQDQGSFAGGSLVLSTQPIRIDWYLAPPAPPEEVQGPDVPSVGSLLESVPLFSEAMNRWLPLAPRIERLAFGAVAVMPVDTREEGYIRLSALLHELRIDPRGSTDLFYQINRPRASRLQIPNLRINRLSKWSVALVQRVTVIVGTDAVQQVTDREPVSVCRVEIDISTTPFPGELPQDQVLALFDELADLGLEIILRGDIQ